MPRKSKLDDHAALIRELLQKGANVTEIWEELNPNHLSVSRERVRKWIAAHPEKGVVMKGRGRPKATSSELFRFLPDDPCSGQPPFRAPLFFLPLLDIFTSSEEIRTEVTKRAFGTMGLPFDENISRSDWAIPAHLLAKGTDLEITLVAYLLSDLPSPPLGGITQNFDTWMDQLIGGASRLKAAIRRGGEFRGLELFPADPDIS